MAVLEVGDVGVTFGGVAALSGVTLEAEAASVTGLIGPNGAGKTTLFNVITGLQRPVTGSVVLDGRDITDLRAHRRARLGVGRTFQRLEVFSSLTVRENVRVAVERTGRRWRSGQVGAEADRVLELTDLRGVADEPADLLPTGFARLVELGRAVAARPKVLLCDECSSGLTDDETEVVGAVIRRLASQGVGILLVEHDMPFVMSLCERIHVLDIGRRIASGTPAEIRADRDVQTAYLGDPAAGEPAEERRVAIDVPARPMIELRGVSAGYGAIDVIHEVDLDIRAGEVFAVLGPNGAGKSTLLRVINGELRPTAGAVRFLGADVSGAPVDALARAGICTIPEGRGIFPNLTVADNLRMSTFVGATFAEIESVAYEQFPRLGQRRSQLAGSMSGGEQQMLALARAIVTDPAVLVIDELSMGLAPMIVAQLYETVAELARSRGLPVVVTEQFARDVLAVAGRAGVMMHGRFVAVGDPEEIAAQAASVYLGEPGAA